MIETTTHSSGNVFIDLGFSKEEATIYAMRAKLMAQIRETIQEHNWTQTEAAQHLDIAQSRVSDLVRGKQDKFSLDMLVTLASRAGKTMELQIA
jgi:predicted XRE-type DNA-binding protein